MYNTDVIAQADQVARRARDDFHAIRGNGAVVLSAIAGAGKSYFVVDTVGECVLRGMRVAVAAPTNEQVFSLVRSLAERDPQRLITFIPGSKVDVPPWVTRPSNVQIQSPAYQANADSIVVGTIDKFASAINPMKQSIPQLRGFDAFIMDESFQADAGRYYAVGDVAPKHMCVGDGGQIHPFTPVKAGRDWRGLAEDPLMTAVQVLRVNHPATPVHQFPITRRLDGRGVRVVRSFYPANHHFEPAVLDGVRQMRLLRAVGGDARSRALDRALSLAASDGWAYLQLPARQTILADPDIAQVIVDTVARLLARGARLNCEQARQPHALEPQRIAIGVAHNNQKTMLRLLLANLGLNQVVVDTANKLQGLEFDVVICWHPLSGLIQADEFHVEAGRMCVLMSRHRHACLVAGRLGDRETVGGLPPVTPAFPGAETDDVLQGWEVHRAVFEALEPFAVEIPG